MANVKHPKSAKGESLEPYTTNAQHGQNRAGVDLGGKGFDDYESQLPFNPQAADDREADEGPEIRARKHALGHDVVVPDDKEG